jgi:hypothetical protein
MAETINLRKQRMDEKVADAAPELINLRKSASEQISKYKLDNHYANVALCLDISASMREQYRSGLMQGVAEKVLALATGFDDDGEFDVFFFGRLAYYVGKCCLTNYKTFLTEALARHPLEGYTNYANAADLIRRHYFEELYQYGRVTQNTEQQAKPRRGLMRMLAKFGLSSQGMAYSVHDGIQFNPDRRIIKAPKPTFVIFQTDGEASDALMARKEFMNSSYEPIFWFLLGLGRGRFSLLEELDEGLPGALTDNASLTTISDLSGVTDDWLFDEICKEYKDYPGTARKLGMIAE